jgi:hypothetical protein
MKARISGACLTEIETTLGNAIWRYLFGDRSPVLVKIYLLPGKVGRNSLAVGDLLIAYETVQSMYFITAQACFRPFGERLRRWGFRH